MRCALVFTVLIGCWIFAEFSAASEPSAVDEKARHAEKARQRGIAAFNQGNYVEAADAFREAYRTAPTWKLLYNIGQSNAAAKRFGLALEAFERYLSDAGDDAPPERAQEVREEIESLRTNVGYLAVTAPDGAIIYINDVEIGRAPLSGPVAVNAAQEQTARAELKEGTKHEKVFRVPGRQTVSLDLTPPPKQGREPEKGVAPETATPSPIASESTSTPGDNRSPKDPMVPLKIAGFVTLGIGAVALIGGAVTGGMSLGINADLKDSCEENVCYSDQYGKMDRMDALALSGTVLLSIGGVTAASGLGLILYRRLKINRSETPTITWTLSPTGLAINGRF